MPSTIETPKKQKAVDMTQTQKVNLRSLGESVRVERERRGMSLEALSKRALVSRSMLSAVERGTKAPTVLLLDRIATGLDTSLARLIGDEKRSRVIIMRT